jgi:hypothetical protein
MSEQLSLFDAVDREKQTQLQQERAKMQERVKCFFCNEEMTRAVMPFNHGIVFNGWCVKALMYHTRNSGQLWTSEAKWLQHLNIDPALSRFDESHWSHQNVTEHYSQHYGKCYLGSCS